VNSSVLHVLESSLLVTLLCCCGHFTAVECLEPLHVAVLYDTYASDVFVKYLESSLNASLGRRTLLPDYEVFVHVLYYEPGWAAVKLMEAVNDRDRKYAAIVGPIDNADVEETIDLTPAARILQVHESDAPHLSDRTRYPYNFRGWRSVEGQIAIWFHIVAMNAWDSVLGIWFSEGEIVSSTSFAELYNISYTASIATTQHEPIYGDVWMRDAVTVLRRERMRTVMLFMTVPSGRMFTCFVHKTPVSGLQYFVPGYYQPGWWVGEDAPCDENEAWLAVRGHIAAVHSPFAPGLNLFGVLEVLAPDGDNTTEELACSPGVTVGEFYNDGTLLTEGIARGLISLSSLVGDATAFFGIAGVRYEDLCSALIALNRTLYGTNVTLQQIEDREPHAFEAVVEELYSIDYQGPSGPFRFYPGTGDPVYVMFLIAQYALPWRDNSTILLNGYITFPKGPRDAPEYLWIPGEDLSWRDGSVGLAPKPELARFPDCSLQNAELWFDECKPCEAGTFFDTFLQACRTCTPLGTYSSVAGMSSCEVASLGHYIENTSDPRFETPCPPGTACPQVGLVAPVRCLEGHFTSDFGSSICEFCPQGQYQVREEMTSCISCDETGLAGSTTKAVQAKNASQCVCPAGTYLPLSVRACYACPSGMECEAGSSMANMAARLGQIEAQGLEDLIVPVTISGHMTLESEAYDLIVYKCEVTSQCPGGGPGTCAQFRESTAVACGRCMEDAYEVGDECKPCGDATAWPFITVAVLALFAVIIATILANRDVHKTPAATLMIVVVTGLLFTSMQALGIFNQVEIPWVEPMKTILRIVSLFSFDLKLLKTQCILGSNQVRSFALRQLVAVGAVPGILFTLLIKKYGPRFGKPHTRVVVELSNSVGTLFSVFFISIVISAMDPFICYEHVSSGLESVRSAPAILCFQGGDHTSLVIIGMVALCLVPLPYLALCFYGIVRYPYAIQSRDSTGFLAAMRFLFFRYTPSCYYFQVFVCLRSLFLCLTPVMFRSSTSMQIISLALILAVYVLVQEELRPWRASLCNAIDACMGLMLMVLLLCGALFLEDTPGKTVVSVMSSILLAAIAVAFMSAVVVGIKRRVLPSPWYHYFICHHKQHAAAQARLMKTMILSKKRGLSVFIDSDNLQELDKLFDVVKAQVGCLTVYLTSDTLKRPWCAGEIVTAFRVKIVVIKVKTPSFIPPHSKQMERMEVYLDRFGCNLSEYNIQFKDVAKAYKLLLDLNTMTVGMSTTHLGSRKFDMACNEILAYRGQSRFFSPATTAERIKPLVGTLGGGLLISTDSASDEANAAGAILLSLISQDVLRISEAGAVLIADHPHDAEAMVQVIRQCRAVAIMLSAGSMTSNSQLPLICEVMQLQDKNQRAPGVVSLNMPGFEFPDEDFFVNILPKVIAGQKCKDAEIAEVLVRLFFKRISMVWPTHASQTALSAQAEVVYKRASPFLRATANSRNSGSLLGSDATSNAHAHTNTSHHSSGDMTVSFSRQSEIKAASAGAFVNPVIGPLKRSTNSAFSINEINWEAFV